MLRDDIEEFMAVVPKSGHAGTVECRNAGILKPGTVCNCMKIKGDCYLLFFIILFLLLFHLGLTQGTLQHLKSVCLFIETEIIAIDAEVWRRNKLAKY